MNTFMLSPDLPEEISSRVYGKWYLDKFDYGDDLQEEPNFNEAEEELINETTPAKQS